MSFTQCRLVLPDTAGSELDVSGIKEAWERSIPLDGTIPAQDTIRLVEALYYGRRCLETLAGLQRILALYFPEPGGRSGQTV